MRDHFCGSPLQAPAISNCRLTVSHGDDVVFRIVNDNSGHRPTGLNRASWITMFPSSRGIVMSPPYRPAPHKLAMMKQRTMGEYPWFNYPKRFGPDYRKVSTLRRHACGVQSWSSPCVSLAPIECASIDCCSFRRPIPESRHVQPIEAK